MKYHALLFAVLLSVVLSAGAIDIGDRIARTFLIFKGLPLNVTAATANNHWAPITGNCEPNFGIAYEDSNGYGTSNPIIMYYTPAGQVSAMGLIHSGAPLSTLTDWWRGNDIDDTYYIMRVSFRDPSVICSNQLSDLVIGDRVVVNQGTLNFNVPVLEADANSQQWTLGNCIGGMGNHWFYDLLAHPNVTYRAEQTAPVVPMYFQGQISAFFFETTTKQWAEPIGCWEGPFIPTFFCKNFCGSGCTWDQTWTNTLHFLLRDHSQISCAPGNCTLF